MNPPVNSNSHSSYLLLAVDGSEHAYAAAQLVGGLPLPAGCSVHVVAALIPRYAQQMTILTQVLKQTRLLLSETLDNEIHTQLLTGDPDDEILTYAEKNRPNLIVMGARGLRSAFGILLGSVAQRVVEHAPCPVLIARAPFRGLKRVLVATDSSESSQFVLRHLTDCPLPTQAEVSVIHVLPPKLTADVYEQSWQFGVELTAPVVTEDMRQQLEQRAAEERESGEQLLAETVALLEKQGIVADGVLRRGDAANEILQYARDGKFDLIVAGSRGLGTLRSLLLGSVSRKLVHYADCSVLIVKPPAPREPIDILQR